MQQILDEILNYVAGMWRFRWRALALAWLVSLAGWAYTLAAPDQYVASTRVYVDTDSTLRPLLSGLAVQQDVLNQVNLMTRALTSGPQLERVARETDLYLRATTEAEVEALLESLRRRVIVQQYGLNTFNISFDDYDREMALRVVETLLNHFVEDSLGAQRSDSNSAQDFLSAQIGTLEQRLNASEQRLADFKKSNVGLLPGEGTDYFNRLQTSRSALEDTRARLRQAERRRVELERQLEGEEPVFGLATPQSPAGGSSQPTTVDAEIAQLETRLGELLLLYTEKYPEVQRIQEMLDRLEARRAEELASRPVAISRQREYNPLDLNPVYQQMRISLSEVEVELVELRTLEEEQASAVQRLERLVDTIPQVEAELARLTRDYDVTLAQYEALLQRLESAKLSDEAEESRDGVTFRIIEPPSVPLDPQGPLRELFAVVALVGGLVAGVGVAFLSNQVAPVFMNSRRLSMVTGLPVAGTISAIELPGEVRRKRLWTTAFVVLSVALLVAVAVVVVFADSASAWMDSVVMGRA